MANQSIYSAFERMWEHTSVADSEIRGLISELAERFNALAESDDTTLDTLKEIVEYIKSNRTLIESITTTKVNVDDIIDNLTTNESKKPLSAAQGKALKDLIDALQTAINNITIPVTSVNNKTGIVNLTASDVGAIAKSGDTMTGALILAGDPTENLHAATKQYVDNATANIDLSTKVSKSGDTMTGPIEFSGTSNAIDFDTSGWIRGKTTAGSRYDIFGYSNPTTLQVGGTYPALSLKGKNTRPTYNDAEMALLSDVASDVFIAEYGVTTYEELEAAYNAGKVLICNYGNSVYTLALADSTVGYVFNSGITTAYKYVMYDLALNMWTNDSYGRVLTQYGVLTNKLVAQSNTNYTTKQVRNIILVADGEEIPAGANGDICLVYAP